MLTRRIALLAAVLTVAPLVGCASDETPDVEPTGDEEVPFDPTVDSEVDTEVEKGENLGFEGDES
ncbi:MAG: hypothetical protein WA964_20060 [Ilumatobacter sp.]|uniref:hypothetical protein n=1 Tax=Ilumatobacter sp. TaxID=1967498 RepID=UPI003C7767E9